MIYEDINKLNESLKNELEKVMKTLAKEIFEESQIIAEKIIKHCESEIDRINKGIAITKWIRGEELI